MVDGRDSAFIWSSIAPYGCTGACCTGVRVSAERWDAKSDAEDSRSGQARLDRSGFRGFLAREGSTTNTGGAQDFQVAAAYGGTHNT